MDSGKQGQHGFCSGVAWENSALRTSSLRTATTSNNLLVSFSRVFLCYRTSALTFTRLEYDLKLSKITLYPLKMPVYICLCLKFPFLLLIVTKWIFVLYVLHGKLCFDFFSEKNDNACYSLSHFVWKGYLFPSFSLRGRMSVCPCQ